MKKFFTLTLILWATLLGYSQVRNLSNIVQLDFGELDYTTYDWQTNWGNINRTIVWPDGKVNFAYTIATSDTYSDCGTGIGTYDSNADEWIPCEGRVENEQTSFGSIARYGDNSIVVVAHTASEMGVYLVEDKDNITPGCAILQSHLENSNEPKWPVVMTSGDYRDIIHIIATGSLDNQLYYFRSMNGGMTWDKENEILPFLSPEFGSHWGSNVAYWMETTEYNCLALVVNNPWSDGMVLYSYDDGETWERKVFYQHPGINNTFEEWFYYPRWASCIWSNNELCTAYEFGCSRGEASSDTLNRAIGGVAFWSESLPYQGTGQPFIMDNHYIEELWLSSPYFDPPMYPSNPEYFGFVWEGDNMGFYIEDFSLHGDYNCGPVAMPILYNVPYTENQLVAVFIALDQSFLDESGNYYFKLFASCSWDGGRNWIPQVHLTDDFVLTYSEFVYPQVAVINRTLIVVAQSDEMTGTYVHGDYTDPDNSLYIGFTYDLDHLFPIGPFEVPETELNTHVSVYPNPAIGRLNVTLNKNAEMKICNILGQTLMTMEGHAGINTLDITHLNSGFYFLSADNNTQTFIVK